MISHYLPADIRLDRDDEAKTMKTLVKTAFAAYKIVVVFSFGGIYLAGNILTFSAIGQK